VRAGFARAGTHEYFEQGRATLLSLSRRRVSELATLLMLKTAFDEPPWPRAAPRTAGVQRPNTRTSDMLAQVSMGSMLGGKEVTVMRTYRPLTCAGKIAICGVAVL
jgi:hypothetical protein